MTRREALHRVGQIAGALVAAECWTSRSWAALPAPASWTIAEEETLGLIGDTILPATAESPGAGSVGIGRFITWMLAECHPPELTAEVRTVLREIDERGQNAFSRAFASLEVAQREPLLVRYEREHDVPGHPFRLIKNLTLLGFFTSVPGATHALRYDPVPGAFHGSVPLGPEDRSWVN